MGEGACVGTLALDEREVIVVGMSSTDALPFIVFEARYGQDKGQEEKSVESRANALVVYKRLLYHYLRSVRSAYGVRLLPQGLIWIVYPVLTTANALLRCVGG